MELVNNHSRIYPLLGILFILESVLGVTALISLKLFCIVIGILVTLYLGFAISKIALIKTLFFLIPFGVILQFGSFEFSTIQLLLLALIVISLLKVCAGSMVFKKTSLDKWMWLFILTFFISLLSTVSMYESAKEFFRWIPFLFSFFFATQSFDNEQEIKMVAKWFVIVLIIQLCVTFFFYPFGILNETGRLRGTMGNPNTFAIYLVLNLGFVASLWLSPISQRIRRWSFIAMCMTIIALVLTRTRGGWIAAFFSIFSLLFLKDKNERKKIIGFLLALFVIGAITLVVFSPQAESFKHTKGSIAVAENAKDYDTAFVRAFEAIVVLDIVKQNPIFGYGLGSFRILLQRQLIGLPDIIDYTADCFIIYLQLWIELGLIGLLAFLTLIFVTLKKGLQMSKHYQNDQELHAIVIGILASMIGFLVHGFADMVIYNICGFYFWMEVGMIFALDQFSIERNRAVVYG